MLSDSNPDRGFARGRVLVLGSINMDLVITAPRYPQTGETILASQATRLPGGKGSNQAVAAAAAGVETEFIGAVGEDDTGQVLREFLESRAVNVGHLQVIAGEDSGLAVVIIAEGDNAVLVIPGANACLSPEMLNDVLIEPNDALVSQFEIGERTVHTFFERGKQAGATTVLNPSPWRPFSAELWHLSDLMVVNESELRSLLAAFGSPSDPPRMLEQLSKLTTPDGPTFIVTLGAAGCVVVAEGGAPTWIAGHRVDVTDTTGAGDCFLGFLAGSLMQGHSLIEATGTANLAASLCVQRLGAGTAVPTIEEVRAASISGA
jgi:ribokinase